MALRAAPATRLGGSYHPSQPNERAGVAALGITLGGRNIPGPSPGILAGVGPLLEHLVDQAERLGLVGFEELVAVHRLLDLLDRLAGVLGVELVQACTHAQDLTRLDLDVRGHALG